MNPELTTTEAKETFTEFINLLSPIDESRINVIPFADSWTAGQLAQHVILAAGGFVQLLNGPVADTTRDPEQNIPMLKALFLDFTTKMKSPDFILPPSKTYDKAELIMTLHEIKDGLLHAIQTLDTSKTCTLFELPNSGHITRAEAIVFSIVHTQRHVQQLKNMIKYL